MFNLSSGLYIISTKDGEKNVGCVVNTVTQSTAKPVTLTVCVHRDNYTNTCIKKTKAFTVSILSERVNQSTIGAFGFFSSRDRDKFADVPFSLTKGGLPYLSEGVTDYLDCKVVDFTEDFTHTIFIAEVTDAQKVSDQPPMTYSYYHRVIKGKAPKNASTYVEESVQSDVSAVTRTSAGAYTCGLCGYAFKGSKEEFESLPDDYVCPMCGAPKSQFSFIPGSNDKIAGVPVQDYKDSSNNDNGGIKMSNLQGTKTEKNLLEAFAGESQARNKYTFYASKAKKEGYEQISAIFEETAGNEKEHAKLWFKLLHGGEVPTTTDNLKAAAAGENDEWTQMYKRMADEAREEGFDDIAFLFEKVGNIEKEHEERYLKLLKSVEDGEVFAKKEKVIWICRNCGHIVQNEAAPLKCPVCAHPQAYFELRIINY